MISMHLLYILPRENAWYEHHLTNSLFTHNEVSIVFSKDVDTGFCEPHLRYPDLPESVIGDYLPTQCLCHDLVSETDADDLDSRMRRCKIAYILGEGLYPRQRSIR